jgi:hypothetical protein
MNHLSRVMAGLVPAIHVLSTARKTWMPGTVRAFTPVLDGLWPGMTTERVDPMEQPAGRAKMPAWNSSAPKMFVALSGLEGGYPCPIETTH